MLVIGLLVLVQIIQADVFVEQSRKTHILKKRGLPIFIKREAECKDGMVECGSRGCLPEKFVCDGAQDCVGGLDETVEACRNRVCLKPMFHQCPDGMCIPRRWVCDGQNDCDDSSDESDCDVISETSRLENILQQEIERRAEDAKEMESEKEERELPCADGKTRCPGAYCIPLRYFCDGAYDCPGHEDEDLC